MMHCIVFSKDRAMQVHATLQSFFAHCKEADDLRVTILYKCSSEQHARQYLELAQLWGSHTNVVFTRQSHFRRDVVRILSPFRKGSLRYRFSLTATMIPARMIRFISKYQPLKGEVGKVLFLVDDTIFTADFSIANIEKTLDNNRDALGFSLRLGKNTRYCYMMDRKQPQPEFTSPADGILKFNWTKSELDFAYPLEVSSSIYRLAELFPLLLRVNFNNPNYLEGGLVRFVGQFVASHPMLLCYDTSVAFCNPVNLVQTVSLNNRVSSNKKYTVDELAALFDSGWVINTRSFGHVIPESCHQEMDLTFEKREAK